MADEQEPPTGGLSAVPSAGGFDDPPVSVPVPEGAGADDGEFDGPDSDEGDDGAAATFGEGSGEDGQEPTGGFDQVDPPVTEEKPSARQKKLFDMGGLEGDGRAPQELIAEDETVGELTASLRSAEVPLSGGLVDPHARQRLFVVAEYDGEGTVPRRHRKTREFEDWKMRLHFRPTQVVPIEKAMRDPNTGLLDVARQILRESGELPPASRAA